MNVKKCIICRNINNIEEHKITKNFNIISCDNKYCKNKIINTIDGVNKIEKYFNNNNINYIGNGDSDSDNDNDGDIDNDSDSDVIPFSVSHWNLNDMNDAATFYNLIMEEIEAVIQKDFGLKGSPIYINHTVVWKMISILKNISKKMIFYIVLGVPSALDSLVKYYYKKSNQDKYKNMFAEFENFVENDLYQIKIKTDIPSVDFVMSGDDVGMHFMPVRINFKNLKKLVDFIAKIDIVYNYDFEEDKNKYKHDIYASLFSSNKNKNDKKDDAIFKKISPTEPISNTEQNMYLTSIESIEQYAFKYFDEDAFRTDPTKYDDFIPNKDDDFIAFQEQYRKYDNYYVSDNFIVRKLLYITENEIALNKWDTDLQNEFTFLFRDSMRGGINIFTLLLAFVTNKNSEWNFEFNINDDSENKNGNKFEDENGELDNRKYNFISYIFKKIFFIYYNKTKLIEHDMGYTSSIKVSESAMFILFLKISMLIPIFFGYQKHYKETDGNKSRNLFKNLGKNLVYIIMEIKNKHYEYGDQQGGKILAGILNKYWVFNYKSFYTYVEQQNFVDDPYIDILNKIENNNLTYDNLYENHQLEIATKKIEMWLFYLMTGSFHINEYYGVYHTFKEVHNDLYQIDVLEKHDKSYFIKFNYDLFLNTTSFYTYTNETFIRYLIRNNGPNSDEVKKFMAKWRSSPPYYFEMWGVKSKIQNNTIL